MKKTGIFGGTFNPIHNGHLRAALEVYEGFALDEVLFVPSYIPPHKVSEEIAAPEIRLEMIKKAVEGIPGFDVCDMEIARKNISYSIDTVQALKSSSKDNEIFFILGTDALRELTTWKRYDELIFMCDFIVMTRPGSPLKSIKQCLPVNITDKFYYDKKLSVYISDENTRIFFYEITQLKISSTAVRLLCEKKKSIKYLVEENVEEYIIKNNLYR